MASNILELINRSLVKIGSSPIQGFEENTAEAILSKDLYNGIRDDVLSSYPWSFATKKVVLNKLLFFDDKNQDNAFNLPVDFLRLLSVDVNKYSMRENVIYTPYESVILTYISRPEEEDFAVYFDTVLVSKLAAEFCLPLTDSISRANFLYDRYEKDFRRSKLIDSGQDITNNISLNTLTDIR